MFRHVLIPTDGSRLSARGARAGVRFAKALGARVTGLYVMFPYVPPIYGDSSLYYVPGLSPAASKRAYEKQAKKALGVVRGEAARAKVTREEIGSYLGLKLETVSRLFSRFQEEGLIAVEQKHVRILDITGLERVLAGK